MSAHWDDHLFGLFCFFDFQFIFCLRIISECASQLSHMEGSQIQLIQNCFISQLTRMGNPQKVPVSSMVFKGNCSQTLVMISLKRILLHHPKDGQFKLSQCMFLFFCITDILSGFLSDRMGKYKIQSVVHKKNPNHICIA